MNKYTPQQYFLTKLIFNLPTKAHQNHPPKNTLFLFPKSLGKKSLKTHGQNQPELSSPLNPTGAGKAKSLKRVRLTSLRVLR